MPILIDGYNLLHASGILGRGIGPGGLERARRALLNFLVESLEEAELAKTIVVFDARDAPPGLPRLTAHRGVSVHFAPKGSDADEAIEQLILEDSAPKRLVVVSSDHRLHRAARRRKATPIDSDIWYHQVLRGRIQRARTTPNGPKPPPPPTDYEVRFWLKQFGMEELSDVPTEQPPADAVESIAIETSANDRSNDAPDDATPITHKKVAEAKIVKAKQAAPGPAKALPPKKTPPAKTKPAASSSPARKRPKKAPKPRKPNRVPFDRVSQEELYLSAKASADGTPASDVPSHKRIPGSPFPPGYAEDIREEDV